MNKTNTLLLVDDGENDRLLMRAAFKKAEFDISLREVSNGEEAMAYLKGEGPYADREQFALPSVMLLDLNMPLKNGFEVLAWVRAQSGIKRLHVIVLTASMRMQDVERAFELGANAFLVKPGTFDALVSMVRCLRDWIHINHFPSLDAHEIIGP